MSNAVNPLSDLNITAYHEAGHTLVAHALGKRIGSISLKRSCTDQREVWEGESLTDLDANIDMRWSFLSLDRHIPYDKLPPQNPDDEYKTVRDHCTVKCAGIAAEKKIGLDVTSTLAGGSIMDIAQAKEMIKQRFSAQVWEKELLRAEAHAREILNIQTCWRMVENLAKELISAIHQGIIVPQSKGQTDWYVFPLAFVVKSFTRTLYPDMT